jgi:iron complex outermembrane receptor protein
VFFNGVFHPTDAWTISAGVRESWDKKTYTYFRSNPDGTVPGPLPCAFFLGAPTAGPTGIGNAPNCLLIGLYGVQGQYKGKRTDYRVETDYRFSPEMFVYASVATGYKGGGVNPRPFFGPSAGDCTVLPFGAPCNQITSFKPETLTTFETGFKADLFDRKLRLNGSAFFNKYNNIILTLTSCHGFSPCLMPANVGKADVWGLEFETTVHPVEGFTLDGSLSYLHFKYKDTGVSGVPLANVTPYTPKWNYSVGAQYDYQMAAGTVSARFDGSYQSTVFTDAFNGPTNQIDGRFLGNARLSYTTSSKAWQVAVEVQNLFNKYYFVTVEDAKNAFGTITGSPGQPRTWAVTIKRTF